MRHFCVDCGAEYPTGFHALCNTCGGMVDVEYDLDQVQLADSSNPYTRFAGLLPITKLHASLPAASYTPMVHATRLGRDIGMTSLYLKNETALPTKTTKDRMAAVSLPYLHERGVRVFSASSTGNSGTSFAYGIRAFKDMHVFLFTAEDFVPRVQHADHEQVTHFGMRDASFVEAADYAVSYGRQYGLVSERGFFNPGRREGLKLAFLEATDQVERPMDWYVQAVSSAMGVYGAYKGAKELHRIKHLRQVPRLLCIQQESCAPMARAFLEGSESIQAAHIVARPTGIAEAILRGDPKRAYPRVRRIVLESGGTFAIVSETEIREARHMVEVSEGISPCFSAAAAMAGLIKLVRNDDLARDSVVVVNLTGGDRIQEEECSSIEWIERAGNGWTARPPTDFVRAA